MFMDSEKITFLIWYFLAMISLRDTLAYLPPFYNLQRGMIYEYGARVHVDQHVARGDGPIIGLEKACRSWSSLLADAQ